MDSGPASWHLPPGPVLRQLKRAAGEDITPADFSADEADQLRIWTESQARPSESGSGRHRSARGPLRRRRGGQHR